MSLNPLDVILALAPSPTPPGTQADPRGQMIQLFGMLALMGVIFYFMAIRPQRVRAKQQEAMFKTLKAGDKIVTSSGIVGTVVSVKEKTVAIRSADTKLEVLKTTVTEITERSGAASES